METLVSQELNFPLGLDRQRFKGESKMSEIYESKTVPKTQIFEATENEQKLDYENEDSSGEAVEVFLNLIAGLVVFLIICGILIWRIFL